MGDLALSVTTDGVPGPHVFRMEFSMDVTAVLLECSTRVLILMQTGPDEMFVLPFNRHLN